jgi:hypothetical protein
MSKTARDYALEQIEKYEQSSILNPQNSPGSLVTASQYENWFKTLDNRSLHIKLDTILERLPYERNTDEQWSK